MTDILTIAEARIAEKQVQEIDSDNRGSADYFIVDRIEEIVERWLNRDK